MISFLLPSLAVALAASDDDDAPAPAGDQACPRVAPSAWWDGIPESTLLRGDGAGCFATSDYLSSVYGDKPQLVWVEYVQ